MAASAREHVLQRPTESTVESGRSPCDFPNVRNDSIPPSETLLRWWDAVGAGIKTRCVSAPEIEGFEQRCGIRLPASFRDYLSAACPVENPSWDNELTNWWPFESLCTVAEGYEHELATAISGYRDKLVLFADYSIWCWGWAINCAAGADHGKVAVIAGKAHDRFVADSFGSFVSRYVEDESSVFP